MRPPQAYLFRNGQLIKIDISAVTRNIAPLTLLLWPAMIGVRGYIAAPVARFVNAASIFEYVFANMYQIVTASELGLQKSFTTGVVNANEADLVNGQLTMTANTDNVTLRALPDKIASYKAAVSSITANVVLTTDAKAPIIAGQSMGSVEYSLNGEVLLSVPLTADFAVSEVLEMSSVQPDETAVVETSPGSTPLISKGHKEWGTADVLTLVFVLLLVLLVALIVVFVITERKRRYERKRRSARARARKKNYYK